MKIILILLALFLNCVSAASADDVLDSMEKAKKFYQEGNYSKAVSELQFTVGLIQEKQVERYKVILPDPPPGWTGDKTEISRAGGLGIPAGITVSRAYHGNDGQDVTVEAVIDSPMVSGLAMIFGNPVLMGNKRLVVVNGEKALEEWDQADATGSLQIIIQNRMLLTVSGTHLKSKDILYEFSKRIDFNKIRKMLQE